MFQLIFFLQFCVGSYEASWNPRKTGVDADTGSQLVCPAIVCDDRRRPIWGTDMVDVKSQVMNLPDPRHPATTSTKDTICCSVVCIVVECGKLMKMAVPSSLRTQLPTLTVMFVLICSYVLKTLNQKQKLQWI